VTRNHQYAAYLLRLWRVESAGTYTWRASLEDPHTGKQRGFADLESLFVYLSGQTKNSVEEIRLEVKEKSR
jgi:hypothetical protein